MDMLEEEELVFEPLTKSALKNLRIKQSKVRNLHPLKHLCLSSIARNMDQLWCKDFLDNWKGQEYAFILGPFDELAGHLTTDLMQILRDYNCFHMRYMPLLITCNLEELDLSGLRNINSILNAVQLRCKVALKKLSLSMCTGMSQPLVKDTLASLTNLRVLDLSLTSIKNDVLSTIGSNCEKLRELNVSENVGITCQGLLHLCVYDGHFGKCKKLRRLLLNGTSVTQDTLCTVLQLLPNLTCLRHPFTWEAVSLYKERGLSPCILHLQEMSLNLSEASTHQLENIVTSCPNIHHLKIDFLGSNCMADIEPLLHLKNIQQLSFESETNEISPMPLILCIGSNITHVTLIASCTSAYQVNLALLDECCPNLEYVQLSNVLFIEGQYPAYHQPFIKLKTVKINISLLNFFPEFTLQSMLSAPDLHTVELSCVASLTDELLLAVLNGERTFTELRHMCLAKCDELTGRSLTSIIVRAPHLSSLELVRCQEITNARASGLSAFIKSNRLKVNVKWI